MKKTYVHFALTLSSKFDFFHFRNLYFWFFPVANGSSIYDQYETPGRSLSTQHNIQPNFSLSRVATLKHCTSKDAQLWTVALPKVSFLPVTTPKWPDSQKSHSEVSGCAEAHLQSLFQVDLNNKPDFRWVLPSSNKFLFILTQQESWRYNVRWSRFHFVGSAKIGDRSSWIARIQV